ncbi:hypothetical protein B0T13DRAFT_399404, partial [Neurospora crassa]
LTYVNRRAETYYSKTINNLGGYNSNFNKRILKVKFNSKLPNVKAIEAINFIK